MSGTIILSKAKNLIDSGTYRLKILRLKPQNDVVGQPQLLNFVICFGFITSSILPRYILMIKLIAVAQIRSDRERKRG